MRISDWSSDVCSSDLQRLATGFADLVGDTPALRLVDVGHAHRAAARREAFGVALAAALARTGDDRGLAGELQCIGHPFHPRSVRVPAQPASCYACNVTVMPSIAALTMTCHPRRLQPFRSLPGSCYCNPRAAPPP